MLVFSLLFVLWAVVHSVTASSRFKAWARMQMGARAYAGTYRLLYNALAIVSVAPVLAAGALALPHHLLWVIEWPLNLIFVAVQLAGLAGLFISLLQTDILRFLGLGQLVRYLRGAEDINPSPILTTSGAYRFVRHPLYFFSLLVLWFTPIMTLSTVLFDIATTAYLWIGSGHEEKRLAQAFGEQYEAYRSSVPRLIPLKIRL